MTQSGHLEISVGWLASRRKLLDAGANRFVADKQLKALLVIALYIGCASAAIAESGPRPPCGTPPFPNYAAPGDAPNYRVWSNAEWKPPACTGWSPKEGVMVAVASQFRYSGSTEGLLVRFGAISTLTGLRYWSVTENDWRTLITHAAALDRADLTRPRADFSVSEMAANVDVYFSERDNRLREPIVYRMRAVRRGDRLVINTENVTSVRKLMVTLVDPGDLESIHFLARTAPGIWSYYGLARTIAPPLTVFGAVREESYVNRALALYSHFTETAVDPLRATSAHRRR